MSHLEPGPVLVRIPADVDREDRIIGDLTARQSAILAVAATVLWLAWAALRHRIPLPAFAGLAAPVAIGAVLLATVRKDGLSLDRWLAAGLRQARAPRRLVPAPGGVLPPPAWLPRQTARRAHPLPAPLRLPATAISGQGTVSLGGEGCAGIAAASTVNFALRTPAEQQALTGAFGRWLNSLRQPAQILIRAHRADLTAMAGVIRSQAPALPHPALEQAALSHAAFLGSLTAGRDLLARQVLITIREKTPELAARRIGDATRALAAAGITVTALDGPRAAAVLAACCHPGSPAQGGADGGQIVTAATQPKGTAR